MDQALSSDRDASGGGGSGENRFRSDRRDYQSSGGGGGGRGYRGGGGGRFRGGGGGFRGGGRDFRGGSRGDRGGGGRFHQSHHRPYGGGGGGGGRGGGRDFRGGGGHHHHGQQQQQPQGNRFYAEQNQIHDSRQRVLQNLLQMVNKVGELVKKPVTAPITNDIENNSQEPSESKHKQQRNVVQNQVSNLQGLTSVVCKDQANIDLFLQYDPRAIGTIDKLVGPMAACIVNCQSVWPLQTPCYAALTLSIHAYSRSSATQAQHQQQLSSSISHHFVERCVLYSICMLSRDLDYLLLDNNNTNTKYDIIEWTRTYTRVRMTLRYLTLLAQLNIIQINDNNDELPPPEQPYNDDGFSESIGNITSKPITLVGLMKALVYAALRAGSSASSTNNNSEYYKNTALLLASLVWSNIPYLSVLVQKEWITTHLVQPLEEHLMTGGSSASSQYRSAYSPGVGYKSILLKEDQIEDIGTGMTGDQDDDDEDDDDEEEDEDDDDASDQVCDTLQDLLRTVKHYLSKQDDQLCRFALFRDAPWKEMKGPPVVRVVQSATKTKKEYSIDDDNIENNIPYDEVDKNENQDDNPEKPASTTMETEEIITEEVPQPLTYNDQPLFLSSIFPLCRSLTMLLGGSSGASSNESIVKLAKTDLNGAVFGRLPIFGPPPELQEEDDDEEEPTKKFTSINERLEKYKKEFGLVDRYYISEAIRDILLSNESSVSEAGVERGSVKFVAEKLWSLGLMMTTNENNDNGDHTEAEDDLSKGIEFVIIENILSLVAQNTGDSPFFLIYLSRVLLELTRLEPAIMSPAIALAVSTLFQDYMPALVPRARYNLGSWFAFLLTNTDYQWPASYWKLWEPFVLYGWRNSRGAFVKGAISVMIENVSNPDVLVFDCLPKGSALGDHLLEKEPLSSVAACEALQSLETDVKNRIWDMKEDDEMLLAYLTGDEVSESTSGALEGSRGDNKTKMWWRTMVVIRAMLAPARNDYEQLQASITKARLSTGDEMNDNDEGDGNIFNQEDVLTMLGDNFLQYKSVVLGVIAKDASALEDSSETISLAEVLVLEQLELSAFYSRSILEGCIQSFLMHNFVKVESIMKWLLGDRGDERQTTVVLRWWEIASFSIQQRIHDIVARDPSSTEMSVDDENTESESPGLKKARIVLEALDPLLSYVVRRVCSILLAITTSDAKRNKFTPEQVDLVEGFKCVLTDSHAQLFQCLRDDVKSRTELKDALSESAIAGPKLASLIVDVGGSPAVDLLRRSLERM